MLMRLRLGLCGLIASLAAAALATAQDTPPPPETAPAEPPAVVTPPPAATSAPQMSPTRPALPPRAAAGTTPAATPAPGAKPPAPATGPAPKASDGHAGSEHVPLDYMSMVFVFMLATFIGIGVIRRVSRLLHTPLMSLTNAISAIAVVGAILVAGMEPTGADRQYPVWIRTLGAIAVFASMTNIISGFLITDRMLKMFKTKQGGPA